MAGPWEDYAAPAAQAPAGPWQAYSADSPAPVYSGSVLPFSRDAQGHVSFDSNAGVLGSLKRAVMLPKQVMDGQVNPNSPEGISRTLEMAGAVSPVNPAMRAGALDGMSGAFFGPLGPKTVKPPAPTADALRSAADSGYSAVRDMGVEYDPQHVAQMAVALRQGLESNDGIIKELAPKSFAVLDKLATPPDGAVAAPFSGIEAARRSFGMAAKDFNNPTDQLAARKLIEGLDNFTSVPPPAAVRPSVSPETAQGAATAIQEARGNYAAAMRSDRLTGLEDAAALRAGAANSGANGDNAIRSRVASLLLKPRDSAGFNPAEIDSLNEVARGTPFRNATRTVGNLLGGGGGLGAVVSGGTAGAAGAAVGGPIIGGAVGAAIPAVGYGAKQLANGLTSRALGKVDELVRQRSPLYAQMLQNAPLTPSNPERQAALARLLMATHPPQD